MPVKVKPMRFYSPLDGAFCAESYMVTNWTSHGAVRGAWIVKDSRSGWRAHAPSERAAKRKAQQHYAADILARLVETPE